MNYKTIILAGLFLPTSGYAQENANRLEELKEILNQKMDEIRELRELISEGLEFLEYASLLYWKRLSNSARKNLFHTDAFFSTAATLEQEFLTLAILEYRTAYEH